MKRLLSLKKPGKIPLFITEYFKSVCSDAGDRNTLNKLISYMPFSIVKIIVSLIILIFGGALIGRYYIAVGLFVAADIILGIDMLINGIQKLIVQKYLHSDLLILGAVIAVTCIGRYGDGTLILIIVTAGKLLTLHLSHMNIRRCSAGIYSKIKNVNALFDDGKVYAVPVEEFEIGKVFVAPKGSFIPFDGIVLSGTGTVSYSSFAGEEGRMTVEPGAPVFAGGYNEDSEEPLNIQSLTDTDESKYVSALKSLYYLPNKQSKTHMRIIDISKRFNLTAIFISALVGGIVPLILRQPFSEWIYRASVILASSGIATLLAHISLCFYTNICTALKSGVIIRSPVEAEKLWNLKHLVFVDKSILLTGKYEFADVEFSGDYTRDDIVEYAIYALSESDLRIKNNILTEKYLRIIDKKRITNKMVMSGRGVVIQLNNRDIITVGTYEMLRDLKTRNLISKNDPTVLYIALGKVCIGSFKIRKEADPALKPCISTYKNCGVTDIKVISDNNDISVYSLAQRLGMQVNDAELYNNLFYDMKQNLGGEEAAMAICKNGNTCGINADLKMQIGSITEIDPPKNFDISVVTDGLDRIDECMTAMNYTKNKIITSVWTFIIIKLLFTATVLLGFTPVWFAAIADIIAAILSNINIKNDYKTNAVQTDTSIIQEIS